MRFGHVNRIRNDRWPKRVLDWNPDEKRKGARRARSWRNGIEEAMEAGNVHLQTRKWNL